MKVTKFDQLTRQLTIMSEEISDGRYELSPDQEDERFYLFADIFPSFLEGKEDLLRSIYDAIFSGKLPADRQAILNAIDDHKRNL